METEISEVAFIKNILFKNYNIKIYFSRFYAKKIQFMYILKFFYKNIYKCLCKFHKKNQRFFCIKL